MSNMFKRLLLLSFGAIIGLVACSAASPAAETIPEGITFRSVDEIVDSELIVTNFAADGSATLPIRTSVPVACTMVYGETPAFGSLTLDQDMAGGTHSDHNPLLSGLKPETEYFFRVQGVDNDGNIYLSEVMNFTTPAFEEVETQNLASPQKGATVVDYSSAFGDAAPDARWGVLSAFDDNPNSEWSTAGDGDEAFVEVELAAPARINGVAFQTRAMGDGSAITLAFTVTADGGETLGPFEVPDAGNSYEFETLSKPKPCASISCKPPAATPALWILPFTVISWSKLQRSGKTSEV